MRMSRKIYVFLLIPAVLFLGGCGYRLTSDPALTSVLTGKKVAIPVFTNKSYRANVGAIMAGSLVDEFARRSGGKVVGEAAAELLLTGTVLSYASDAVSYTAADKVKVHYSGTLVDGKEFDSSYKRGQPATFPVKGVIKGWTEVLQLMPVGSKWQVFIPSSLAYGERGAGMTIGPNATLIFEIELVAIK